MSGTVEEEGGLLVKVNVVNDLLKSGVGELDCRDDFVAVGLEGKSWVENGAKVGEFGTSVLGRGGEWWGASSWGGTKGGLGTHGVG
jgi:hypothetical protein